MLILQLVELTVLASGAVQIVSLTHAKLMEQLNFVVLEQNASGIAQEQPNALMMYAHPMQQMHHAHPM